MAVVPLGVVVGKSAYQSAVDAGFKGAEAEWAKLFTEEPARAQAKETELEGKIDSEATRAEGAEAALQASITAEAGRAEGVEAALQASIIAEAVRAEGAEAALQASVNAEAGRAEGVEAALQVSIDAEAERATVAEAALQASITAEAGRAGVAEAALQASIMAEAVRAEGAEAALHVSIEAEADRALKAESVTQNSVNAETARAVATEGHLAHLETADKTSLVNALNSVQAAADRASKIDGYSVTRNEAGELQTNKFTQASNASGAVSVGNSSGVGFLAASASPADNALFSIEASNKPGRAVEGGMRISPLSGDETGEMIAGIRDSLGRLKFLLVKGKSAESKENLLESDELVNKGDVEELINQSKLPEHYKGQIDYAASKASIEAAPLDPPPERKAPSEGSRALALDTSEHGVFEDGAWVWSEEAHNIGDYWWALALVDHEWRQGAATYNGEGWDVADDRYFVPDEDTLTTDGLGQMRIMPRVMSTIAGAEQTENKISEIGAAQDWAGVVDARYPTVSAVVDYVAGVSNEVNNELESLQSLIGKISANLSALAESVAKMHALGCNEPENPPDGAIWLETIA
jgi:hypothetical protein